MSALKGTPQLPQGPSIVQGEGEWLSTVQGPGQAARGDGVSGCS